MRKSQEARSRSLMQDVSIRFRRNRVSMIALAVILLFILVAVCADLIVGYDVAISQSIKERLQGPSASHIFGTDGFGRDIFARVVHGTRISLIIGVLTTVCSMLIACVVGALAGYFGGMVESVIMRFTDILISIPASLLVMSIVAAMGASIRTLVIAMTVGQVASFVRIVRAQVMGLRGADFIEAARVGGARDGYIIMKHVLPNAIGPIIVQGTMNVANAIISASSYSFIGLGVEAPRPEWGVMLSEAKEFLRTNPYQIVMPLLAIVIAALSFNLFGDGLRDSLDPRLKD